MMFSELRQLEMQIGFTWGILIGALAAAVSVIGFANMAWYYKVFAGIGSVGVMGSLAVSLYQLHKARKSYISTKLEMDRINEEAMAQIQTKIEEEHKEIKQDNSYY
jgi:hypothetical protein